MLATTTGTAIADDSATEVPPAIIKKVARANGGGCDANNITAKYLDATRQREIRTTTWLVDGCPGMPYTVTTVQAAGPSKSWYSDRDMRKKAPFDLACEAERLAVTYIDPNTRGVTGCDKRITYMLTRAGWVANVASSGVAP